MDNLDRLRDESGLYLIDYTDLVIDTVTNTRQRVTGFYYIQKDHDNLRKLISCVPEEPRMTIITTTNVSAQFHRPWKLDFAGLVAWSEELIATQQQSARNMTGRPSHICSNGYPELFRALGGDLSAHELLALKSWKQKTSAKIYRHLRNILVENDSEVQA